MPKTYRWQRPIDWLNDKANEWDDANIRSALKELALHVDGDTIQDIFGPEMDRDGYFDPKKEKE